MKLLPNYFYIVCRIKGIIAIQREFSLKKSSLHFSGFDVLTSPILYIKMEMLHEVIYKVDK